MNEQDNLSLDDIAPCLEGIIPSAIATVAADGTPNLAYLSVVTRVDPSRVALSRQFFLKTERNTDGNPYAQVGVIDPETGRQYQLDLIYERTDTEGPLFERMRTKLDAVAAYEGMSNVFRLKGTDICRVLKISALPCDFPQGATRRDINIAGVEEVSQRLSLAGDMDELLTTTLSSCQELLGFGHAFIMLVDESNERLYTVASAGYAASGAGSEIRIGEGLIGVAAERHQSVRVTQMARELAYTHAVRDAVARESGSLEKVIPLPTLPSMQSQLVTPMLASRELAGVLCLQSPQAGAFKAADECIVGIIANQVAMAMVNLRPPDRADILSTASDQERPVQVKYYRADGSVFLDNEYLIKGVAGGILWRLLRNYKDEQRVEFSNREIRLDESLELPDIKDNLEARLILLRKRLEERSDYLRIEKTARGRFRLVVSKPLNLVAVEGGGPL